MARKAIPIDVERKLCAESMGRCMNPNCQAEMFRKKGNVIEKANITPYCNHIKEGNRIRGNWISAYVGFGDLAQRVDSLKFFTKKQK